MLGEQLGRSVQLQGREDFDAKPRSCNMGVWWDGDLLREILDGATIDKWDYDQRHDHPPARGKRTAARRTTARSPTLACAPTSWATGARK